MKRFLYKEHTRRNLPHWHPPGTTLFVTFRLAHAVPNPILRARYSEKLWLEEETSRIANLRLPDDSPEMMAHRARLQHLHRRWFSRFEKILHKLECGEAWLKDEAIAAIVAEALHKRDRVVYRLDAFCIMPNHVHVVFAPHLIGEELDEVLTPGQAKFVSDHPSLGQIMQSLKGWTARKANAVLQRGGPFWESESYDHVVRNEEEFFRIVAYVLNNPVKAGLVRDWRDWKWTYLRPTIRRDAC
jgi:putative transposase